MHRAIPVRRRHLGVLVVAALAASGVLVGCSGPPVPAADAEAHEAARAAVAEVSRGLYRDATDVIEDYARWADADMQTSASVELIGFADYPGAVHGEPFGALQFRATVSNPRDGGPYIACFESEFDYWGVATKRFGD